MWLERTLSLTPDKTPLAYTPHMLFLVLACRSTPAPAPAAPPVVAQPAPQAITTPEPADSLPAASGNLTVHLDTRAGFTSIEVVCPSGFRQRAALIDGIASLDSLPAASCVANFKGGPPARFAPLSAGTWRCQYTGTTMSCAKP